MFVKCRYEANENGSQGIERGFYSEQIEGKNTLSIYAHISRFERYRTITTTSFINSLDHLLWLLVSRIDCNCCFGRIFDLMTYMRHVCNIG
jgi:hypothetical protein